MFQFLNSVRVVSGEVYIYAQVNGFYGWYKLEPVETPLNKQQEPQQNVEEMLESWGGLE